MAKVILICGKICSGKTTYAERLRRETGAVLLSVDEIMLALFGLYAGDKHDEYANRTKQYLYEKSLQLVETGHDVLLDWGSWTKAERQRERQFYASRGIPCEFHCIEISEETWKAHLEKRNRAVMAGEVNAYIVDENLAAKFLSRYEPSTPEEIDVWVRE